LNAQGLVTVEDFVTLKELDIDQLCAAVHRPGGMVSIPNPSYDANNPQPGVPQNRSCLIQDFPLGLSKCGD
jgi:hypothetical protein